MDVVESECNIWFLLSSVLISSLQLTQVLEYVFRVQQYIYYTPAWPENHIFLSSAVYTSNGSLQMLYRSTSNRFAIGRFLKTCKMTVMDFIQLFKWHFDTNWSMIQELSPFHCASGQQLQVVEMWQFDTSIYRHPTDNSQCRENHGRQEYCFISRSNRHPDILLKTVNSFLRSQFDELGDKQHPCKIAEGNIALTLSSSKYQVETVQSGNQSIGWTGRR